MNITKTTKQVKMIDIGYFAHTIQKSFSLRLIKIEHNSSNKSWFVSYYSHYYKNFIFINDVNVEMYGNNLMILKK